MCLSNNDLCETNNLPKNTLKTYKSFFLRKSEIDILKVSEKKTFNEYKLGRRIFSQVHSYYNAM